MDGNTSYVIREIIRNGKRPSSFLRDLVYPEIRVFRFLAYLLVDIRSKSWSPEIMKAD